MTRIVSLSAKPYEIQLKRTFATSQGSTVTARGVSILLRLEGGQEVHGEAVPVAYVTHESVETVIATVEHLAGNLVGQDVMSYAHLMHEINSYAHDAPSARLGLEMAILKAWSFYTGVSLWKLFGGALHSLESDVTIPLVENSSSLAKDAIEANIHTLKVKVGSPNYNDDIERVKAIAQAAPSAKLRIDANQAYTAIEALKFVDSLTKLNIIPELLEQPTPASDPAALAEVAKYSSIPVFADESCCTPYQALKLADTPVQGFNLKLNKSGIRGLLDIIAIGRSASKILMIGCMLETRMSISVSVALACGTGAFHYIDLDSHLLLDEKGENPYFIQDGATITLGEGMI